MSAALAEGYDESHPVPELGQIRPELRLIQGAGAVATNGEFTRLTDPAQLTTEAIDLQQIARGIVASLSTFIPKLNGRILRMPHELAAWHRMPEWQKMGLRLRDESFRECPAPLQEAIWAEARLAIATADASR